MRYLLYLLLALFGLWLLTGVTQVQPGERAVIRRFGRVLANKPGPGLYVGFPWGIERVDCEKIDLERGLKIGFEAGPASEDNLIAPGQLLTGDHNLINLQIEIRYSVIEDEVVDYVVRKDRVEPLLARTGDALLCEWVAGRAIDDVWGRKDLPGARFVRQFQERIAGYRLGINIRQVNLTHLSPPSEVKEHFEMVSSAQAEIDRNKNVARNQADRDNSNAMSEKIARVSAARADEHRLIKEAEAEAATFSTRLKQYQILSKENPHYVNALWWDEMGKLYARMRQNGRIDLLDNHIGADGLDITQFPPLPRKK